MLTVRVNYPSGGHKMYSCHWYEVRPDGDRHMLELHTPGGRVDVVVPKGTHAFAMNSDGNTVDVIRQAQKRTENAQLRNV